MQRRFETSLGSVAYGLLAVELVALEAKADEIGSYPPSFRKRRAHLLPPFLPSPLSPFLTLSPTSLLFFLSSPDVWYDRQVAPRFPRQGKHGEEVDDRPGTNGNEDDPGHHLLGSVPLLDC